MTAFLFGHTYSVEGRCLDTGDSPVQFLLLYNGGAHVTQYSVFLVSLILTDSRILICLLHRATRLSTAA